MKNWEFYEEELKKYSLVFAMKDNQICWCSEVSCNECVFNFNRDESYVCDCIRNKMEWLYQECKKPIVLTDDEKALCKLLGRGWIARDKNDLLYWYENKPTEKHQIAWCVPVGDAGMKINTFFPQCKFEFIRWEDEEPWEVKVDN